MRSSRFFIYISFCYSSFAVASDMPVLSTVTVHSQTEKHIGIATTASEGIIEGQSLTQRAILRTGEILETVPGLVVTQHSSDGKANQYFLRGFNLDHGTDFATSVLDMPVNMPTHGHGQGYSDLNFVIPELIASIHYRKGSYDAKDGDFASAGSADIDYLWSLPQAMLLTTLGEHDYQRLVFAQPQTLSASNKLWYALELQRNNGPWQLEEDLEKVNAVLRFTHGKPDNGWAINVLAYDASWQATDQIPERLIQAGVLDRYDTIDKTDGGNSRRLSLSWQHRHNQAEQQSQSSFYVLNYELDLYSNFSYFLDNPSQGDQFHQVDKRTVFGFQHEQTQLTSFYNLPIQHRLGIEGRYDAIDDVGLYLSQARQNTDTIREDKVQQTLVGLYGQQQVQWTPSLRSLIGLRADFFYSEVEAHLNANSGQESAHIFSPKFGLSFNPTPDYEYYANWGYGFHSNDARGTSTRLNPDPRDANYLQAAAPSPALVKTRALELGLRTKLAKNLDSTLAIWQLDSDSELVFIGDAGNTEENKPSKRYGVELSQHYALNDWLSLEADITWSKARFKTDNTSESYIPNAVEKTGTLGMNMQFSSRWFLDARVRYLGSRPLTEDNQIRADSSTVTNLKLSYHYNPQLSLRLDVLNVFNQQNQDIAYYYASCTPYDQQDSACSPQNPDRTGIEDVHVHPAEARSFRVSLQAQW